MFNNFKKENAWLFVGGAAAGVAVLQFLKSKSFHNLAVGTVAKGISLKDTVFEEYTNIKEEAEDICAEAHDIARQSQSDNLDIEE